MNETEESIGGVVEDTLLFAAISAGFLYWSVRIAPPLLSSNQLLGMRLFTAVLILSGGISLSYMFLKIVARIWRVIQ